MDEEYDVIVLGTGLTERRQVGVQRMVSPSPRNASCRASCL
ncbi:GDI1 isoform 11 [Pan troglodytes]|uniref:GDP dissociation inhibitor 1 n=3 Tax=Hominidae TaxID=9604 RepID=F8WE59_HUMAN|nr:GDI1 isoform 11 [Pan troglodytes]PNJ09529.1 GDI1 isoform 3 [Pongo abelii]